MMIDHVIARKRGGWWPQFIAGDVEGAITHLAANIVRIGPRNRDANHEMGSRDEYAAYLRGVVDSMPRLAESTVDDISVSPDGRKVYLHVTEIDSVEPGSYNNVVAVKAMIINSIDDDGLINHIDIYWKTPTIDYEWTGTKSE